MTQAGAPSDLGRAQGGCARCPFAEGLAPRRQRSSRRKPLSPFGLGQDSAPGALCHVGIAAPGITPPAPALRRAVRYAPHAGGRQVWPVRGDGGGMMTHVRAGPMRRPRGACAFCRSRGASGVGGDRRVQEPFEIGADCRQLTPSLAVLAFTCIHCGLTANSSSQSESSQTAAHSVEVEGKIVAVLPGTMFRVQLANGHIVLAHISGKLRKHFIRLAAGDRVKMEMSPYDIEKARITFRVKETSNTYRPPMRRRH